MRKRRPPPQGIFVSDAQRVRLVLLRRHTLCHSRALLRPRAVRHCSSPVASCRSVVIERLLLAHVVRRARSASLRVRWRRCVAFQLAESRLRLCACPGSLCNCVSLLLLLPNGLLTTRCYHVCRCSGLRRVGGAIGEQRRTHTARGIAPDGGYLTRSIAAGHDKSRSLALTSRSHPLSRSHP